MSERIDYVVGFYTKPELVLLIKKERPQWQKGKLNGVGGHIEDGEDPIDAMVREFGEETGVYVASERWDFFCHIIGNGFSVYFFRADWEKNENPSTTTDEGLRWRYTDELWKDDIVPNVQWLVPMAELNQKHDWPFLVYEKGKE